jgi:hypothetical protein
VWKRIWQVEMLQESKLEKATEDAPQATKNVVPSLFVLLTKFYSTLIFMRIGYLLEVDHITRQLELLR